LNVSRENPSVSGKRPGNGGCSAGARTVLVTVLCVSTVLAGAMWVKLRRLQALVERLTEETKELRNREADLLRADAAGTEEDGARADRLLRTAHRLAKAGQLEASERLIDMALSLDPDMGDAYLLRGLLRVAQGDYADAETAFESHGEYALDDATMELLSACRSARERETRATVALMVWQLERRGLVALARHLESRRVPGLLGTGDPSFSDIVEVLEAWDTGGLLSWTRDALEEEERESLVPALELAGRCQWEAAAMAIRTSVAAQKGSMLRNDVAAAFAFAFHVASETTAEEVVGLFSATSGSFAREVGTILLHYGHGVRGAWETAGHMADEGGAIVLSAGSRLPFAVPFRRDEGGQHARFRGRLMGMAPSSVLWICWETGWEDGVSVYATACMGAGEEGRNWGACGNFGPGMEPTEEGVRALSSGYGRAWHTLEASVHPGRAEFAAGEGEPWGVRLAGSGPCRLELAAREERVHLDWLEVSGSPDGIWLARQLLLRRKQIAETRHSRWRAAWHQVLSP